MYNGNTSVPDEMVASFRERYGIAIGHIKGDRADSDVQVNGKICVKILITALPTWVSQWQKQRLIGTIDSGATICSSQGVG